PRAAGLGDHVLTVDPGAEGAVPGAGQDHGPHVVVEAEVTPQAVELSGQGAVEAVEPVGSVQHDGRDAVRHLDLECFVRRHDGRLPTVDGPSPASYRSSPTGRVSCGVVSMVPSDGCAVDRRSDG